ncbi:MAG: hypothetical protein ABIG39_05355 [Candidatus Micrarchaeota archaeon]
MAKKETTKKKGNIVDFKFNKELLEEGLRSKEEVMREGLLRKQKEVEMRIARVMKIERELEERFGVDEIRDRLKEDIDIKEIEQEIKQKPLLYTAFAFTAGVALGVILARRG